MNWMAIIVGKCVDVGRMLWSSAKNRQKEKEQKIKDKEVNSITYQKVWSDYKKNGNKVKYQGYKIRWNVEFYKLENSLIHSQLFMKNNGIILCTKVLLNDYPELKNEREGEKYVITGIIEKTDRNGIYLNNLIGLKKDTFFVF